MKNQIYFILMVIFLFSSALHGQNELTTLSYSPDYDQLKNPIIVPYDNSGNASHGLFSISAYEGHRNGKTEVVIARALKCDGYHGDLGSYTLVPNFEGDIKPIQMLPGANDSYILLVQGYNRLFDYNYFNVINFKFGVSGIQIIWQKPLSGYDITGERGDNLIGRDILINNHNKDIYIIAEIERKTVNYLQSDEGEEGEEGEEAEEDEENSLPSLLIVRLDPANGVLKDHKAYSHLGYNCDVSSIENFENGHGGMVVCGDVYDRGLYFFVSEDLNVWYESVFNGPIIQGVQSQLNFKDITVDNVHGVVYILGNFTAFLGHSTFDVVTGHMLFRIGPSGVILRAMRYDEESKTLADEVDFQIIREKASGKIKSYHVYISGTMEYTGFQTEPHGCLDGVERKFFLQETDMFCNTRKFEIPSYATGGMASNSTMTINDYSVPLDPGCRRNMFFSYEYNDLCNNHGGGHMVIHHSQKDEQSICHQEINFYDQLESSLSSSVTFREEDITLDDIDYIFPDRTDVVDYGFVCSHLNPNPEFKGTGDLIDVDLSDTHLQNNSQNSRGEIALYEIYDLSGRQLGVEQTVQNLQARINNSSFNILLIRTVYKDGNSDTQKVVPGMFIMGTANKK